MTTLVRGVPIDAVTDQQLGEMLREILLFNPFSRFDSVSLLLEALGGHSRVAPVEQCSPVKFLFQGNSVTVSMSPHLSRDRENMYWAMAVAFMSFRRFGVLPNLSNIACDSYTMPDSLRSKSVRFASLLLVPEAEFAERMRGLSDVPAHKLRARLAHEFHVPSELISIRVDLKL